MYGGDQLPGPGKVTLTSAGPQNWDLVPPAFRIISSGAKWQWEEPDSNQRRQSRLIYSQIPLTTRKSSQVPRSPSSDQRTQDGEANRSMVGGTATSAPPLSFASPSRNRGEALHFLHWNDGNCPPSRPGSGSARCYARTFPDHAERELGAKAPTGVARLELATGRLTAVSSAIELHANTCPKAMLERGLEPPRHKDTGT